MTYGFDSFVPAVEHARTLLRRWRPGPDDREAIAALQRRKVAALVAHCRAHVALYRDLWRDVAGGETRLHAFPAVSKDDFRSRPSADALVDGTNAMRLVVRTTSGSSGQPFAIRRTSVEDHLMQLFRMRAEAQAGVRPGDRILRFAQLPAGGHRHTWPGRVRNALRLYRDGVVDGLADGTELLDALDRRRPDVVRAYPSTLVALAHELDRRGRRGTSVRIAVAGGEMLVASARRAIGETLGAKVVGVYGMSEFNLLASECPAGHGFHVCDDNVVVEVLDSAGRPIAPGETGEVVATSLHAWTMPFVRYRTGDLATRGPERCACGAPWTTLSSIHGRVVDLIRRPDGREVHPYRITGGIADDDKAWIVQHQLVQADVDHVVLSIVVRRAPAPGALERLRSIGTSVLGPGMRFDVRIVERFASTPGGKFAPYVSRIAARAPAD